MIPSDGLQQGVARGGGDGDLGCCRQALARAVSQQQRCCRPGLRGSVVSPHVQSATHHTVLSEQAQSSPL